jgi:hypothetical protein
MITKREGDFKANARGFWSVTCYDKQGNLKWTDNFENLVLNEGLDYLLDVGFHGGSQINPWYVGLLAANPVVLPAWTDAEISDNDFTDYDEATLPAYNESAVSGQSITNSSNKATFTISQNGSSVGGCFLISTDAKAPSGTVYCAGAFGTGNKSCDDGDTLQVVVTLTTADDGV